MNDRPWSIMQVSMFDRYGGAERVAWDLFQSYRRAGHHSYFAVGRRQTDDPNVLVIPNHEAHGAWARFWWSRHRDLQPYYGRFPGSRALCRLVHRIAEPRGWLDALRGREDFRYPGTFRLLEMTPRRPDIIHCHNLHQKYFNLRALPWLSWQTPLILTLHDAWLLAGHCAHSLDCDRWKTGCGQCPALSLYSPIRRDGSADNWRLKRDLYAVSRLHVATPCRWLMDKVEQSILAGGMVSARVIPYGVDLDVFHPGDRAVAREQLALPHDARILLFAASGIRNNVWKDYRTMQSALARLAERFDHQHLLFVALGEDGPPEHVGSAEIRFVPFQTDPADVARYYRAANLYIHAARADTFPNTVLEALCCGTPVVATAVGGIPEQIRGLERHYRSVETATGILTPPGDAEALAGGIERLLKNDPLRQCLARNAARDAAARFDLRRQVSEYLAWYEELITGRREIDQPGAKAPPPSAPARPQLVYSST